VYQPSKLEVVGSTPTVATFASVSEFGLRSQT